MKKILTAVAALMLVLVSSAAAADDPLARLTEETLQFFRPVSGKVVGVEGSRLTLEMNTKEAVKPGTRLNILREGEPFRHPVTREVLGRVESVAGKAEVSGRTADSATGVVISGSAQAGDRVRISETKVKMVFIQDRKVDWYLGDDLYRKLKATGRVEMSDSALETDEATRVLEEARRLKAEVAVLLTAKEADKGTLLREQAFWVSDGSKFYDSEVKVDIAFTKELKFGGEFFGAMSGEALFRYNLPFGARLVVTGDFDGDGKQKIALSTGKDVRTYLPAIDLQPLWELKGSVTEDHLWLDSIDLNRNGKDELIITSMRGGDVVSTIYELTGSEFRKLWEGKYFLRRSGTGLIAQKHSQSDGYQGDVYSLTWDGDYKIGDKVKLPKDVNIYDFSIVEGPSKEKYVLAYDDKGFLSVFDERGIRIWRSTASLGSFNMTYKKQVAASYLQADDWSVKDRILLRSKEALVVQRVPLAEIAKGVGNKKSRIKSYWWSGFSMDESVLIDDVAGTIYDYALAGDKLVVLSTPFLGVKFENLLKGENPLGAVMSIYSVRGR